MTTTVDLIIIGGGIHGCSTALHLARRGLRPLVIEKDYAGRHASGVNAGGVRQLARALPEVALSVASMSLWERIVDLVGDDCGFQSHGQVLVAETDDEFQAMRERVEMLNAHGFRHEELIDQTELRRLVPAVADYCPGGIVSRRDGAADPFRSTQAFRRAAIAAGAVFREGEVVRQVERVGQSWQVSTDKGRYQAGRLVNAAGGWADRIAAMVGETLPLQTIAPMLMITTRLPAFIEPVVILRSRKLSFKQFPNGTVMIGGGHLAQVDRDHNTTRLDWTKLHESARTVWELFPIMREASIQRAWAGIEGRMSDDLPVMGPSAVADGVWHQCGFSAHGFQLGPAAGQAMAELIIDGHSSIDLSGLQVGRFSALP
ncbi:MAG: hypothetical protein RI906_77 [Pseudomonadota bacterium]|jgi:sarcosine oxidase subunit beta